MENAANWRTESRTVYSNNFKLRMSTQRVLSFMLRDKWSHFLLEFIADLPLVARHTLTSETALICYLTIPFGIDS